MDIPLHTLDGDMVVTNQSSWLLGYNSSNVDFHDQANNLLGGNMSIGMNNGASTAAADDRASSICLTYDFVVEALLMGAFCIFGFVGNTMSMICLWKDTKTKTATPFLLISLEIADTLFLVTVLLLRVLTSIHQFTKWFTTLADIFPYFGSYVYPCAQTAMTSTIYLTILVTVNRYISVCRPYEASNLCSIQQARKQVILVWVLCVLYNIPRFFESHVVSYVIPGTNETKIRSYPTALGLNQYYQYAYGSAMYFLVMFLVPLITLIILNYKLICALRETQKRRAKLLTHDSHSHNEDDITLTLIVVVLVFLLTQTPALVTQILLSALPRRVRVCPSNFFFYVRLSDMMVVANSASNFIIYCFCSKRFRQILIDLVCMQKLNGSPENSMSHAHHTHNHVNNAATKNKQYKPVALNDTTPAGNTLKADNQKNGHSEITAV